MYEEVNTAPALFSSKRTALKSGTAMFTLLVFLTLQVFGASHALHHALHHDAPSATHECAITVVSQGHLENIVVGTAAAAPDFFVVISTGHEAGAIGQRDYRISIGRGPPALL